VPIGIGLPVVNRIEAEGILKNHEGAALASKGSGV